MFSGLKKKVQIEDPEFKILEPNSAKLIQPARIHHKPNLSESNDNFSFHVNKDVISSNISDVKCNNCQKLLEEKNLLELALKEFEIKFKQSEKYSMGLSKDILDMKNQLHQLDIFSDEPINKCLDFIKVETIPNNIHSNEKNQEIVNSESKCEDKLNSHLVKEFESHDIQISPNEEEFNKLLTSFELLEQQVLAKNKTIKKQEQLINDLKKTIQKEFTANSIHPTIHSSIQQPAKIISTDSNTCKQVEYKSSNMFLNFKMTKDGIPLNEMNFKYLRHVILKFMLCPESEALQLIKAISVLLNFTEEEQKFLRETLKWRMSWFGSRPQFAYIS